MCLWIMNGKGKKGTHMKTFLKQNRKNRGTECGEKEAQSLNGYEFDQD